MLRPHPVPRPRILGSICPDGDPRGPPAVAVPAFDRAETALTALGPTLLAVVRPKGQVVCVSAACRHLVGLPQSALRGRPLPALVEPSDRDRFERALQEAAGGHPRHVVHGLIWTEGRRTCLSHLAPIRVGRRRLVHVSCTDIAPLYLHRPSPAAPPASAPLLP